MLVDDAKATDAGLIERDNGKWVKRVQIPVCEDCQQLIVCSCIADVFDTYSNSDKSDEEDAEGVCKNCHHFKCCCEAATPPSKG